MLHYIEGRTNQGRNIKGFTLPAQQVSTGYFQVYDILQPLLKLLNRNHFGT